MLVQRMFGIVLPSVLKQVWRRESRRELAYLCSLCVGRNTKNLGKICTPEYEEGAEHNGAGDEERRHFEKNLPSRSKRDSYVSHKR